MVYALMFCRIALINLFMVSAGGKIVGLRSFVVAIDDFKLLPRRWSRVAALLILGCEITVVVLLGIGGRLLTVGFLLIIALMVLFSAAMASILHRKIDASCNCFGPIDRTVSSYDLARNVVIISGSALALWLVGSSTQELPRGEGILIAVVVGLPVLLLVHLRDVVETLFRPL